MKPVDSAGGKGVMLIEPGTEDLTYLVNEALAWSPSGKVIAEEWIHGSELQSRA